MIRSRAVDWALGALGMLVLIAIALAVLWWTISEPAVETTGPTPVAPVPVPSLDSDPPSDLADDEVWIGDLDLQSALIVLPDSTLTDVEARGHGARTGSKGLIVQRLDVEATVPFREVAAQLGGDSLVLPAEGGQASVVRTVELLGRGVTVVATGTVEVERGLLVVEPTAIDVGLPDFLSRTLGTLVREFVTIKQPIEGLPENLELLDVAVQDDGFRATLAGNDVVLAPGES
ncbi:LmeA family phospholipid-binding protein [Tessaracoccus flavus]|uniref:Uncharacterized protein n=1 Tax=Tessaracoccus flavus TaxID=1610493 RepID=A0A1Q2CFS1_9ACTN|nr:LmeA family phospholipid-binding protein [Tessaracoccus flavus]AQP44972.1 hypothetical protein RPIT_09395 [Tessaracoccus flavus]SDY60499.1 hypothetical protein SAMN05428934_102428 [Tessaracoccus flavus]